MIKIFTLLSVMWMSVGIGDIAKINDLKKKAEQAYILGDFEKAASSYSYLVDSMNLTDEKVVMNLANSYAHLGKAEEAQSNYRKLILSKDNKIKSLAYQQLGAMSNDPKTLQNALTFFKESLKSDPTNEDARYNYELVKKKLKDQKDQSQDDKNQDKNEDQKDQDKKDQEKKDQENKDQKDGENKDQKGDQDKKDQENKDKKDGQKQESEDQKSEDKKSEEEKKKGEEGKEGDEKDPKDEQQSGKEGEEGGDDRKKPDMPPSTSEKLKQMNISQEKAKMILEALKNSEIQYIQQNQRKATKSKDSGKPDW